MYILRVYTLIVFYMVTKVQKWGNSLAVRLPKKIVVRLGLRIGNAVQVDEGEENIVIRKIEAFASTQKRGWKQYVMPTNRKKEGVSENIDKILYGKSH